MHLNDDDINNIRGLIKSENKSLKENLEEKIGHLPTKDDFYNTMDQFMGELQTIRQELVVQIHQVTGHEKRIAKIEDHLHLSV